MRCIATILAAGANGLGAVRSLHTRGIATAIVCKSRTDMAYYSRFPLRKYVLPKNVRLSEWLTDFVRRDQSLAECLIPTSDEFASVLQSVRGTSELAVSAVLPPRNLVDTLNDKVTELELIGQTGIPLPRSFLDLEHFPIDDKSVRFPIIVKPRSFRDRRILGAKNRILNSQSTMRSFLDQMTGSLSSLLAQEVIPGDELNQWVCNATFDAKSEMVSAFTFQRYGTIPYRYGVTTFAISRHNTDVKELCMQLGRRLGYVGPAMFEFKWDPRDMEYRYIETNPRLGMCNWFDTRCGVNNVFNSYALCTGLQPDRNIDAQKEGIVYLDMPRDVLARMQAKVSMKSIVRTYRQYVRRKIVYPSWFWRDPMPIFATPMNLVYRLMRRRADSEKATRAT